MAQVARGSDNHEKSNVKRNCQFSLRSFVIGALFVGSSCGALCRPSAVASMVFTNCSFGLLFTALLAAICCRGRIRSACLAFVVSGYAYCLFANLPDAWGNSPRRVGLDGPTMLLQMLWTSYHEPKAEVITTSTPDPFSEEFSRIVIKSGRGQRLEDLQPEFFQIGHSVVLLTIGWVAGLLSFYCSRSCSKTSSVENGGRRRANSDRAIDE